jgi:hypothetical protein
MDKWKGSYKFIAELIICSILPALLILFGFMNYGAFVLLLLPELLTSYFIFFLMAIIVLGVWFLFYNLIMDVSHKTWDEIAVSKSSGNQTSGLLILCIRKLVLISILNFIYLLSLVLLLNTIGIGDLKYALLYGVVLTIVIRNAVYINTEFAKTIGTIISLFMPVGFFYFNYRYLQHDTFLGFFFQHLSFIFILLLLVFFINSFEIVISRLVPIIRNSSFYKFYKSIREALHSDTERAK